VSESEQPFRVLIVEDDPGIRRLAVKLLQRKGMLVDTAADGRVAMEKIRDGNYTVIILDLMLPEASGYEVIDFIKSNGTTTSVAVVSAVSQQALTRLDLDVVKLVISKPFDVDEFTKAIVGLCHDAQAPAS
jgi:DNA-binding response OmpR family regulator